MTAARHFLRRIVLLLAALVFASAIQLLAPSHAFASIAHHSGGITHAASEIGIAASGAAKTEAVVEPDAAQSSDGNALGCLNHPKRMTGQKSGQCCGSGCCVAAMLAISEPQIFIAGASGANLPWAEHFTLKNPVFGSDRPPDFRS